MSTNQVKVTGAQFDAHCRVPRYFGVIAIHQPRGVKNSPIPGALVVVFDNLTPGVTLANADGEIEGAPYRFLPNGLSHWATAIVPLKFANPARAYIRFTPRVHQLVSGEVEAAAVRALTKPFTIVAIPDTQVYSEEGNPGFQQAGRLGARQRHQPEHRLRRRTSATWSTTARTPRSGPTP